MIKANSIENFEWALDANNLKVVELQSNSITSLKLLRKSNNSRSVSFNLESNRMKTLKFEVENLQFDDNFTLILDKNYFDCDLSLFHLFNLQDQKSINLDFGYLECVNPEVMKGKWIGNLRKEDLMCNSVNIFSECKCIYHEHEKSLFVDCSGLEWKSLGGLKTEQIPSSTADIEIKRIQLNIANNFLKTISPLSGSISIEIHASNNLINELSIGDGKIDILDIRNNSLIFIDDATLEKLMAIRNISLGGNPWRCECSRLNFFTSIKNIKDKIHDYENVYCENLFKPFADLEALDVCFELVIYFIASLGVFFGLLGVVTGLFYRHKKDIKIFLYAHNMCLWFVKEDELDEDKVYDAFVCFAADDQPAVEDIIVGLETEPNNFKCLVGVRDWPPGHMFAELVSSNPN